MKLKIISNVFKHFLVIISFCVLSLDIFCEISFSESPGIKITQPQDGSVVTPGQEVAVTVESEGGFVLREGWVAIGRNELAFTVLPTTVIFTIPYEAAGKIILDVLGKNSSGRFVSDEIALNVQQTATLQSLEINQDEIFINLDWDGNIKGETSDNFVTIYGNYSDRIKRILDDDPGTSYASSDPSIISVDNKGNYQVHKVGDAEITISNSGLNKVIPLVFLKPRGIKPSEAIPPTTTIDIHPPANQAGWYNSDIEITLTAADNEGGSGIQDIEYVLIGLTGMMGIPSEQKTVQGDRAQVFISREGIARLGYYARDNERNAEKNSFADINLDKTPPTITSAFSSQPNPPGWHNSDVTISFTAQDSLSGIKTVTPAITISTEGANQIVAGEAIDLADNKVSVSVILNIDKTPPKISLELKPIKFSGKETKGEEKDDKGNWHEFLYSATDNLSGLKNIQAGFIVMPLSDFKQQLEVAKELNITIDEKKKEVEIKSTNPQELLAQLQSGLLTLSSNQILQLKIKRGDPKWKISQKDKGIEIQAPSIIFKAKAEDIADNTAVEELIFATDKH